MARAAGGTPGGQATGGFTQSVLPLHSSAVADSACCLGRTWAFPALCTHRHAWPLVTFPFLAGLRFNAEGLDIVPSLPQRLGAYSYGSPLAAIAYDGRRRYSGVYRTSGRPGRWRVRFDLSAVASAGCSVHATLEADAGATAAQSAAVGARGQSAEQLELRLEHASESVAFAATVSCDQQHD